MSEILRPIARRIREWVRWTQFHRRHLRQPLLDSLANAWRRLP